LLCWTTTKEIVAVLHIEPKARIWTDDGLTVTQEFECTIEAERWFFSWKTAQGEDLRIPSRKEWKWESDDERFYVVTLDVESKILDDGRLMLEGINLFHIEPVFDLNDLADYASKHISTRTKKLERPEFDPRNGSQEGRYD
jgi:hypothetical protein